MQAMNIFQQEPISQNLDNNEEIIMKKLMENLKKGKKSAKMMRSLILQQQNPSVKMEDSNKRALNHHSMVCLDTFATSLSILKSSGFDGVFARKRNQVHLDEEEDDVKSCSYEDSADQGSPKMSTVNGRRDCYKKRKIGGESREEEVTNLTDDGYAWRKYGQKLILNSHHPRHYYRCTHKHDQSCPATKQVQQISEKPIKYKVIYNGNHTCNNNFCKTPPSFTIDDSPGDHPSAFVLSFDRSKQVNPMLFPTPSSAFPSTSAAIVCQNSPSVSSNNNLSILQDTTTTMTRVSSNPNSELSNEVSVAEIENYYGSTATSVNLEEDNSFVMADYSDFFPDWWTTTT